MPEWFGQIITMFGPVSVLVWYVWYTTSKTLPERDRLHADSLEKIRESFVETVEKISLDFTTALKAQQQAHDEQIERLLDRSDKRVHDERRP